MFHPTPPPPPHPLWEASSLFSPDGGFQFEELLRGLDDPDVVAGQDAGAQEEAHVPVALQLVQAAFLPHQAAQLHPWKTDSRVQTIVPPKLRLSDFKEAAATLLE